MLRSPAGSILSRFQAGGLRLKLVWYGFMLTAVLLAPLAVLLGQVLARDGLEIVPVTTTIGVLAAVVQFLGLARWPFLVPALAASLRRACTRARRHARRRRSCSTPSIATSASPSASASATSSPEPGRFSSAIAMLQSSAFDAWLAWPGIAVGALLVLGSLEFVGRFEENGWKLAGTIVPIAYTAWSLWLIIAGAALLWTLTSLAMVDDSTRTDRRRTDHDPDGQRDRPSALPV